MGYGYYRTITIDHTKVPGNLTSHPFLFNTTHSDLRTVGNGGHVTSASGYDIVFSPNIDGSARYDHEIEKYVAATGELVAHVRIPVVSSTVDTVFYIVYGDSGVTTSQEDITGVWDASYEAVWHLNDDFLDSTANDNDLTNAGSTDVAGKIADGQELSGADTVRIDAPVFSPMAAGIISFWMRFDSLSGVRIFYQQRYNAAIATIAGSFQIDNAEEAVVRLLVYDGSGWIINYSSSAASISTGAWYYIAIRWDATNGYKTYINGVENGTDADIHSLFSASADHDPAIGALHGALDSWDYELDGKVDEFRIESSERSVSYIQTTYNNQSSPGTFYALQATEQIIRSPRSGVTFASCLGVV